jgi:hypothetical protein
MKHGCAPAADVDAAMMAASSDRAIGKRRTTTGMIE